MDRISNTFMRPTVMLVAAGFLTLSSTASLSNEANCRRLEDLARQYAGVQLTSQQQQLKRRLVAWYNSNCRTRHANVRG